MAAGASLPAVRRFLPNMNMMLSDDVHLMRCRQCYSRLFVRNTASIYNCRELTLGVLLSNLRQVLPFQFNLRRGNIRWLLRTRLTNVMSSRIPPPPLTDKLPPDQNIDKTLPSKTLQTNFFNQITLNQHSPMHNITPPFQISLI